VQQHIERGLPIISSSDDLEHADRKSAKPGVG
jgi:hypothetical protein